jgi:uncharacterized membrane-anchored protein YhcB (DUF1043 family)
MTFTRNTFFVSTLVALIVGLLIGFVPEHMANSSLQKENAKLTGEGSSLQVNLNQTEKQLALSNFSVRAATVPTDADRNDYSIASSDASSLFTDLRQYVDKSGDRAATVQLSQALAVRDRTIAGLAKADPGTKQLLLQLFLKMQSVSSQSMQGR